MSVFSQRDMYQVCFTSSGFFLSVIAVVQSLGNGLLYIFFLFQSSFIQIAKNLTDLFPCNISENIFWLYLSPCRRTSFNNVFQSRFLCRKCSSVPDTIFNSLPRLKDTLAVCEILGSKFLSFNTLKTSLQCLLESHRGFWHQPSSSPIRNDLLFSLESSMKTSLCFVHGFSFNAQTSAQPTPSVSIC